MSLATHRVPIVTASDGTDLSTINLGSVLVHAVRLELGTLTTPDITITEEEIGDTIVAEAAIAADKTWYPSVVDTDADSAAVTGSTRPYPVIGRIQVAVAGGGDTKT